MPLTTAGISFNEVIGRTDDRDAPEFFESDNGGLLLDI